MQTSLDHTSSYDRAEDFSSCHLASLLILRQKTPIEQLSIYTSTIQKCRWEEGRHSGLVARTLSSAEQNFDQWRIELVDKIFPFCWPRETFHFDSERVGSSNIQQPVVLDTSSIKYPIFSLCIFPSLILLSHLCLLGFASSNKIIVHEVLFQPLLSEGLRLGQCRQ